MDLFWDTIVGRGAFGDFWRAKDQLDRNVAVKFFNDTIPSQLEKNALDHARALARVDHPAVVRVLAVEVQQNPDSRQESLAIIMEYVSDTSLLKHKGPMSLELAAQVLEDLACALTAIHDAGLVHGDLHEGNVMLTGNGAKVIDILYTHTLANVGTKTANQSRGDDVRSFAVLARMILAKTDCDAIRVQEAFYQASAKAQTPEEVLSIFLPVFERVVILNPKRDSAEQTQVGASIPPEQVLSLISDIQSNTIALSGCVSRVLAIAISRNDEPLKKLCELELMGYTASKFEVHADATPDDRKHRVIRFYSSFGATINLDAFESVSHAIEWMESNPKDFPTMNLLYPDSISKVERTLPDASRDKVISMSVRGGDIVPNLKNPNIRVMFYVRADTLVTMVENLKSLLTGKLLQILG